MRRPADGGEVRVAGVPLARVDEPRAAGVSAPAVQIERDGWIQLMAPQPRPQAHVRASAPSAA
jgi:hypothetical protein